MSAACMVGATLASRTFERNLLNKNKTFGCAKYTPKDE
jgi:hypothetical protein